MTENNLKNKQHIILYWTENLVGNGSRFTINMLICVFGGFLYSFNIWNSPIVLVIFGVVSPLIFTLCLYFLISILGPDRKKDLPKLLTAPTSNLILMCFDMAIIVGFAALIHTGYLNYFVFRFLQTVFFPLSMIFFLRLLYLSITSESDDKP
jgi:hypothetical protein